MIFFFFLLGITEELTPINSPSLMIGHEHVSCRSLSVYPIRDPCILIPADMQSLAGYSSQRIRLPRLGEPYTTLIGMHALAKHEKYWT